MGRSRLKHAVTFTVALLLTSTPSEAEELEVCMDGARTQHALLVCASEWAGSLEKDRVALLARIVKAAGGDRSMIAKVNAAEKAWIDYRRAFIEAMYPAADKQVQYGSRHPMDVNLLHGGLTFFHLRDLQALLEQIEGPLEP